MMSALSIQSSRSNCVVSCAQYELQTVARGQNGADIGKIGEVHTVAFTGVL